ncbi:MULTISPECIES: hypothetical protein [Burkholderia cepacia complex]|uniref:hypothetical protein n=1 Tax=Burkholderia cepacia complex TaxID=87882 RepID=UPI0012FD857F|nr:MULTISPECIES: hypothetical protein [Burkholderia cepacia complex]MCW3538765.1 hypothetical protein [Burkholderia cenocepacia]MDN8051834.1 hypothetical protein [Burkholderia multivorans]
MPALEIMVDGNTVVMVSTNNLSMLAATVSGMLIHEAIASLNVSGGNYSQSGSPTYLTWIADTPLQAGQRIRVLFHQDGQSSHAGKTIDELYPDEPPVAQTDFTPTAEMFQKLRAMPKVREKFLIDLNASSGASFHGETTAGEDSFALSILWDSMHPERARASLYSNSLDNLEVKGAPNSLLKENITWGGFIELRIS